jgi:hypothetical protein
VIYADPPWRFEPYSRDTGMDRAADNHYPTMTIDRLKDIVVPAADDCVLCRWATAPMLREAHAVMAIYPMGLRVRDCPGRSPHARRSSSCQKSTSRRSTSRRRTPFFLALRQRHTILDFCKTPARGNSRTIP